MKQKKIQLALIGGGGRPRGLWSLLKNHPNAKHFEFVGVADPLSKSRSMTRAIFGQECRSYANHRQMLQELQPDWVLVGSPNHLHCEHVLDAFAAGAHVFCEKPLATSLQDCLIMEAAAKKARKTFFFGLCLRYSPLYRRIKQLLAEGIVGKIVSCEFNETLHFNHGGYIMGNWRRDRTQAGTHLLEKCCHDIDLSHWLIGSVPVRVASFGGLNFFTPKNAYRIKELGMDAQGKLTYQAWFDHKPVNPFSKGKSIVDNQVAILEYANGVRATFHTNCNAGLPERRFYIVGTHGTLRADHYTGLIEWQRIGHREQRQQEQIDLTGGHGGADERLIDAFAETAQQKAKPLAGMREGIRAAVTCFGIDRAMDTGKVVDMRPLWKQTKLTPVPSKK